MHPGGTCACVWLRSVGCVRVSKHRYAGVCEWGTDRALLGESVQKAFVRGTLQVPLSTTVVLMKSEVGTKPLVHA